MFTEKELEEDFGPNKKAEFLRRNSMITCPVCRGFGKIFSEDDEAECISCENGKVPNKMHIWQRQGQELRRIREEKKLTLREASEQYNIDFSNLGKMEKGLIQPKFIY